MVGAAVMAAVAGGGTGARCRENPSCLVTDRGWQAKESDVGDGPPSSGLNTWVNGGAVYERDTGKLVWG